jgi:hypothetical protein
MLTRHFTVCSVYAVRFFLWRMDNIYISYYFPVTIVSFGYRYVEPHNLFPVFIIQFIMFIITFSLSLFIKTNPQNKQYY